MMLNKHLDILVNHWQRFIRPVKTGIGLRIGGPETEVPYMEMRINNFWHIWKLARIFESLVYIQERMKPGHHIHIFSNLLQKVVHC